MSTFTPGDKVRYIGSRGPGDDVVTGDRGVGTLGSISPSGWMVEFPPPVGPGLYRDEEIELVEQTPPGVAGAG